MKEDYLSLPNDYYPAAYWFWHRIPSKEEIESQLLEMRDSGYKTFLIQARLAFPREAFLSDAYLDAYRYAVIMAKKIGLTAGFYDDYNWISGHAGGRTVQGHDSLRERHLFWSSTRLEKNKLLCSISDIRPLLSEGMGNAAREWIYEDGEPKWGDWKIFKVMAYSMDSENSLLMDITSESDFVESGPSGCSVVITLPEQVDSNYQVTAFVTAQCTTSRLINYLNPDATLRFLEVNYEVHRAALEEFFGDPIRFIFFDHPYSGFYSWKELEGNIKNSLMFDETLVDQFFIERGYPIEEALLAFIKPFTAFTPRFRCDLFDTYGRVARENFFKPIAEWSHKNGLLVGGHEMFSFIGQWGFAGGFSGLDVRCNFGADYFSIDQYKDLSTVDACNYHSQVASKMGDSTAKAHGRRGCIVEQYSVSEEIYRPGVTGQWDLTLNELRSQAIRHHLLGARQFLFHGYYQTDGVSTSWEVLSNPRFDFPPGINFEPWFRFHKSLADELAWLSAIMGSGDSLNNLAVLYPLHTYWSEGADHSFARESAFWNRWLFENGFEFDVVDERQIEMFYPDDRTIKISKRIYHGIVLPGVTVFDSNQTAKKILSFAKMGGLLVASGLLPSATQTDGVIPSVETDFLEVLGSCSNAFFLEPLSENSNFHGELESKLRTLLPGSPRVSHDGTDDGPILLRSLIDKGDLILILFNDSQEDRRVEVFIPGDKLLAKRWWPNGENAVWGWFLWSDNGTHIHLQMESKGLACFRLFIQDTQNFPHLISSTANVLNAYVETEEKLTISFAVQKQGRDVIQLFANQAPRVNSRHFSIQTRELGDNLWEIITTSQALPPKILLDGEWFFHIEKDQNISRIDIHQGWEQQGFPSYTGKGIYEIRFDLPTNFRIYHWDLIFNRVYTACNIVLNDVFIGHSAWPPYHIELPIPLLASKDNRLIIEVFNTAGNYYYHDTPYQGNTLMPSGLIGPPVLQPKWILDISA